MFLYYSYLKSTKRFEKQKSVLMNRLPYFDTTNTVFLTVFKFYWKEKYYFGKLINFYLSWWLNSFQKVPVQILFLYAFQINNNSNLTFMLKLFSTPSTFLSEKY